MRAFALGHIHESSLTSRANDHASERSPEAGSAKEETRGFPLLPSVTGGGFGNFSYHGARAFDPDTIVETATRFRAGGGFPVSRDEHARAWMDLVESSGNRGLNMRQAS
jgi:hypothetical protein